MHGFFNRVLQIDLSRRSFAYEELSDELLACSLGGKGLGTQLLLRENPPGVDPLAPENVLLIACGPVTGTHLWSQSRYAVFSKSPLTGGFAESYCGGSLAGKIKGCGVDAILVRGRCRTLSYLTVDEEGVRFGDAAPIAGRETPESEAFILRHSAPGAGAMVIGPAGERLVRLACIKSDRWRSCGRTGMGAVLGAKRLKGISFAGRRRAAVAQPELLRQVGRDIAAKGKASPGTAAYRKYGTPLMVALTNTHRCFPTRYWSGGVHAGWEKLSGDYLLANFEVHPSPCPNCFLSCTKKVKVLHGRHRGLELEGPEYETIYAFGGLNELDCLEEVAFLNELCDRLGLDTISAGNLCGLATEAWRRGKSTFALDYNQPDRLAALLRQIAARQGLGDLLARGIQEAAGELGLEDVAVHAKGLEPAGFDPRVLKGMGLSYATSARGACHLRGTFYKAELSGQIAPEAIEGKARLHVDYEDRAALFDALILCRFYRDIISWEEIGRILIATTGLSRTREELELLANRITEDSRAFNRREGLGPEADTLSPRLLREATAEGARLSAAELQRLVADYDAIRSRRAGRPDPLCGAS